MASRVGDGKYVFRPSLADMEVKLYRVIRAFVIVPTATDAAYSDTQAELQGRTEARLRAERMRVMAHLEGQTALPCDACLREQAKREEAEHQLWLANVKVEELMAQITGMQETIDDIKCNLPKTVKALLAFSPQPPQRNPKSSREFLSVVSPLAGTAWVRQIYATMANDRSRERAAEVGATMAAEGNQP